jgi:hypothetical protein
LTSAGGLDGFVLKLDTAAGDFLQVLGMGGVGDEQARPTGVIHSIVDGAPHTTLYVSGSFQHTASFPTGGSLTSAGDKDIFLMALDQSDPVPTAQLSTTSISSLSNDLALLSILNDADGAASGSPKKRG